MAIWPSRTRRAFTASLVGRGVGSNPSIAKAGPFKGVVAPLENIDMMPAPKAGAVLYHVKPGDHVKKGDLLATIVHAPGEAGGRADVTAPQAGYILTRRSHRITRSGDDLLKLVGSVRDVMMHAAARWRYSKRAFANPLARPGFRRYGNGHEHALFELCVVVGLLTAAF